MVQLQSAQFLDAKFLQFLVNQANGLFQRVRVDGHIDIDESYVRIGGVLRFDSIREAVFLADIQPEARTHCRAAQHIVQHYDRHS